MQTKLTKKQALIIEFITDYTNSHGVSPTYREIMTALGLSSVSAVAEHISNLINKGALRKVPGTARSLEVIDYHIPEVTALFELYLPNVTPSEAETLRAAAQILGIKLQ